VPPIRADSSLFRHFSIISIRINGNFQSRDLGTKTLKNIHDLEKWCKCACALDNVETELVSWPKAGLMVRNFAA